MKNMKKDQLNNKTQRNINNMKKWYKRRYSAGFSTLLQAGTITSLISSKNKIVTTVLLVLFFTLSFVFNLAGANNTYAANSISLSISNSTIALDLMSLSSSGTFAESPASTITVSTTSPGGYNLSIASSNNSTALINTTDSTKTISSISQAINSSTFSTNSNYTNKWGYKPSKLYNTSTEQNVTNSNFLPLPGENGQIIAQTACANGTSPCTSASDTYTLSIGAKVNNQTAVGTYQNNTYIITAITNSNLIPCDPNKLCVEYEGNGLVFGPDTLNRVNYNSTTSSTLTTKYAHTENIDDSGTASDKYPTGNIGLREIVTIPGASSMTVTISYSIEENWDYLYVFTGEYTGSITGGQNAPMDAGQDYTLTGGTSTTSGSNSTTFTITGDTVTFAFWSDLGTAYYGYYATITGYGYSRTVSSGKYATPTGTNAIFNGWSTVQTTPGEGLPSQVEYANESDALANIYGNNGDTITLYAVWQQGYPITFTYDSNVSSITVMNSIGETVGTITSSGQSIILPPGEYVIGPAHVSGYATNNITKTTGAGTLNNRQFTVGNGSATINVTSKGGGSLYNLVAAQVKKDNGTPRTQTLAEMQAIITKPSSFDPNTDTSNSGVFKYDASTFGTASDASNNYDIYYFRGILDGNLTYGEKNTCKYVGSCGNGVYYPNYVVLSSASSSSGLTTSDTCWRIVRTTGSGGVKMIYNGKWTGSTCANAGTNAEAVSDVYFNRPSTYASTPFSSCTSSNAYCGTVGFITYVGYNYNSTYGYNNTGYTSAISNNTLFTNGTASNLRIQLENWYNSNTSGMSAYTSKLESSAGWCNDRTTYNTSNNKTTSNKPYDTNLYTAEVRFGPYIRHFTGAGTYSLTLTCTNATDLLTITNGLGVPAAPLTADEMALAGSGSGGTTKPSINASAASYNSYLRSGSYFWTLSPNRRNNTGSTVNFFMSNTGSLTANWSVFALYGVRPAISLSSGTTPVNGIGTAANPWIVNP